MQYNYYYYNYYILYYYYNYIIVEIYVTSRRTYEASTCRLLLSNYRYVYEIYFIIVRLQFFSTNRAYCQEIGSFKSDNFFSCF